MDITLSPIWQITFPGAQLGLLHMTGIDNSKRPTPLDAEKRRVEAQVREQYGHLSRAELREDPTLAAYHAYYKRFKKSYHVQLQLESVALKGKGLPTVNPLVDSYFAAELESFILTAGHDADKLNGPVTLGVTEPGDTLVMMNGETREVKPGDMKMMDGDELVCTILYGQDKRTPITPQTSSVLYVAYVPAGVEPAIVRANFERIKANVALVSPEAEVELEEIFSATNML